MIRTEEFTFDSRDGKTKLHAMRWLPEGEPVAVLQIIHGMNEYIRRYDAFAAYMAERGFVVVGEDHLGHGESVSEGGTYGYFCDNDPATVVVRDVHRLKKLTQQDYPTLPYLILGHSMGSFILRNYITRYGTGISGAIICGTGTPKKSQLLGGKLLTVILEKLKGDTYVSKLVNEMSTKAYMSGEGMETELDWLCSDRAVQEAYAKDPLCSGFTFIRLISCANGMGRFCIRCSIRAWYIWCFTSSPIIMYMLSERKVISDAVYRYYFSPLKCLLGRFCNLRRFLHFPISKYLRFQRQGLKNNLLMGTKTFTHFFE